MKKIWLAVAMGVVILGAATILIGSFAGTNSNYNAKREVKLALRDLKNDPANSAAAMRAGMGYYRLGLFNQAEEYYKRTVDIEPGEEVAWNYLGNTYRELLRYQDAETAYANAMRLKPDYVAPYVNLVELYRLWQEEGESRSQQIVDLLNQGLTATKNSPEFLPTVINYYEEINDAANAEKYRQILSSEPAPAQP